MQRMTLLFISFLFFSLAAQQKTDEEAVRAVADNILSQPVTQFVGVDDGVVYNSTKEIPKGKDVRFKSPLTEWHYSNGVLDMAMIKLGVYLNEEKYVDYAKNHVAFGFNNYPFFKERFRNDMNHWLRPFCQFWNMKELDDCGAMGAAVIEVYQLDKKQEYIDYIDDAAKHIMVSQDRLQDGTLSRTFPREMTIWADDAYMATSLLTRMGKFKGDQRYFDEAAKQLILLDSYLWDETKGLYYHCYYADLKRNGVAYWAKQ